MIRKYKRLQAISFEKVGKKEVYSRNVKTSVSGMNQQSFSYQDDLIKEENLSEDDDDKLDRLVVK